MLIDFSGDPVRGKTAPPLAGQSEPMPNAGVFTSILSALIGGEKPRTQDAGPTPFASLDGQTDPHEPDDPSSASATQSGAPDRDSADPAAQWTPSPETMERSPDNNSGLAAPSGLPGDDPDDEIEAIEGALPMRRQHSSEAALTTQHIVPDASLPLPLQGGASGSSDQTLAGSFEKAVSGTAFVASSQARPHIPVPTVASAATSGPAVTMTSKYGTMADAKADAAQTNLTRESLPVAPATDPALYGAAAAKPLPLPFVHNLADTRATPSRAATARSVVDGAPSEPSSLVPRNGSEGGVGNGPPPHGALATSLPPAPAVDLVGGLKKPVQEAGSPIDPRRVDGSPPATTAAIPRSSAEIAAAWTGDAPKAIVIPSAMPALPTPRGAMQTALTWSTSGDGEALGGTVGGPYAHLSAAALPPDIADVQPRPAADLNREIARQIGAQVMNLGHGRFEMSLSPSELGRVEMWLQDTDNRLTLIINTERPETLDLMRRHIGLLEQEMRQLCFGSLTLQLGADGSAGSHSSQKHTETPHREEEIGAGPARESGLKPQVILAEHLDIRL